jgi:O-antigen ligase
MVKARKLKTSEGAAIGALVALVSLEIIAFGATEYSMAQAFAMVHAAFLIILLASCAWARKVAGALPSPGLWALFGALILALAWALTPFGPGGAHPVWQYVAHDGGSMTVDRSVVLQALLRLSGLACLFLAAQIIGRSETRRRAVFWMLLLALGSYAGLAIIQHVSTRATGRLTMTLLSPNTAATLMGMGVVFSVMYVTQFFQRAGGAIKLDRLPLGAAISLAFSAVFAVALALTASRAGLFSTIVALAILLTSQVIAQGKKVRVVAILGGAAALLVAVGVAMRSAELTAARLENLDSDVAVRQAIFAAHWEAFLAAPWFGYGLGSFPAINQLIMTSETLRVLFDVRATHNLYLQWLEEAGVVGSLCMLALMGALLWPVARSAGKPGTASAIARAAIAATVLVLLHGLSDFAVQTPALQALFAVGLGALTPVGGQGAIGRMPAWRAVAAFGGISLVATALVAIPMVSTRFGGDLSSMPTASAEVLAVSIEKGLAAQPQDKAGLERLDALSRRELAMRPGVGSAWLRNAAVAFERNDITAGNVALSRSYAVAPLQTSLFMARTRIAYEHWGVLTPEVRQQVLYQAGIEYKRPGGDARLTALANSIQDPSGQIGLSFFITAQRLTKAAAQ